MGRSQDKAALVTGGAAGIGLATARLFRAESARVALVDLRAGDPDAAVADPGGGADVPSFSANVYREGDTRRCVLETVAASGAIDVLGRNTGIEGRVAPPEKQTVADLDCAVAADVRHAFLGLRQVLPIMGARRAGSVVNMSSIAGLKGSPNVAPYITSKHAVVGLTRAAAVEAAPFGVRVNSVHPSPVETRMMRLLEEGFDPGHGDAVKRGLEAQIPLGRYGQSEDVAQLVLFLASDASRFVTGAQYPVDGGMAAT
jgi:NAD(P)-dependent dehydrogenase (short-subunit alcohol dehydrogenase family)